MPQVLFTWHGGETLCRPLSFYKKAMELQKKYARGRTIDNCIQTNGTMLTDEWCEFFRENNWLVVSPSTVRRSFMTSIAKTNWENLLL